MEWESDRPYHSHTYPRQECWSPGKCSGWGPEFRDYGAIPGQGLLLTAERWIEGMWERRSWWEMLVEESQAAMEARRYCWVTRRGWSHHHSLSLPTRQHRQLSNKKSDPQKKLKKKKVWPIKHMELQSRTPARGAPLWAWHAKQQRRTTGEGAL